MVNIIPFSLVIGYFKEIIFNERKRLYLFRYTKSLIINRLSYFRGILKDYPKFVNIYNYLDLLQLKAIGLINDRFFFFVVFKSLIFIFIEAYTLKKNILLSDND